MEVVDIHLQEEASRMEGDSPTTYQNFGSLKDQQISEYCNGC